MDTPMMDDANVEIVEPGSALAQLNRSEIDMQITTAKRYPRSIHDFIAESRDMACLDEETAGECIYALVRGNKTIQGPSARFAEIIASAWGNCRAAARVVGEDDKFVTSQGMFFDVQRNVAISYEVRRRITDRFGKKYGDDMVGVTANAACSIALRNAVLKGIPKAYWKRIYEDAKRTAIGDAKSLTTKVQAMLDYFGKMGISPERVLEVIEKPAIEDVGADDLLTLKGIATAIKDGDSSLDEAFPPKGAAEAKVSTGAAEKLASKAAKKGKPTTPDKKTDLQDKSSDVQGEQPAVVQGFLDELDEPGANLDTIAARAKRHVQLTSDHLKVIMDRVAEIRKGT